MRFGSVVIRSMLVGGLAAALLAGCHSTEQLAQCPAANVLANTAQLTEFRKGMENDPSGELYTVEITGVKAVCDIDKYEGTASNDLVVSFRATRPPNGDTANYTVPYYLATMVDGSKILSKQILAAAFTFGPAESQATFTVDVPSVMVHFANGKKPYDYGLLVGLQLTRDQLNYASTHERYAP